MSAEVARTARRGAGAAPWIMLAIGFASFGACGDGPSVLTIYSPHGRELLSAFERRFEAEHPGVDVQWVDMGSQEVVDRVRSERANPQGDVWFGGPFSFFGRAADEGLLAPYRPAAAESLRPEARGRDDLYHGVYLTPAVIAYNSDVLSAEQAPQDWDDVLDPRWRGSLLIRDPLASGTMRTIFGMIMYRAITETGDTAAGYGWLRRLDRQTKEYVLNPAILYQKLARQEGVVTLWNMPDMLRLKEQGLPLDYVIPAGGTPVLVDGIAVIGGASQPELAYAFVDYALSMEAQIRAAREFFRIPTRTDLPRDSLPAWLLKALPALEPMQIDWDLVERRGDEWMRYWDAHIRNSS